MKFWVHNTKEKKGRRFFFHLWTKDDRQIFDGHIEVYWRRRQLSFKVHFGNRSSETPFDGHFCIPFLQIYWGCDFKGLGQICEAITFGHKRDLSLSIFGGSLWWKLWYDDDMGYDRYHDCDSRRTMWWWPFSWYRKKYRSWACLRDGSIDLNPFSVIWGSRLYEYEDLEKVVQEIEIGQFPGDGPYMVEFTLQQMTQRRRHGFWPFNRATDRGKTVKWWCNPGIPTKNHDWKGDETLGSSVHVDPEYEPDWQGGAETALIEQIIDMRKRYNYHPPKRQDA